MLPVSPLNEWFHAPAYTGATKRGMSHDADGRRFGLDTTLATSSTQLRAKCLKTAAHAGPQRWPLSFNHFALYHDGDYRPVAGTVPPVGRRFPGPAHPRLFGGAPRAVSVSVGAHQRERALRGAGCAVSG